MAPPVGMLAPLANARLRLTVPATKPLIIAICSGSAALSLRVRLLSMPHVMQARTISTLPQLSCGLVLPPSGQESSIAPARDRHSAQKDAAINVLPENQPGYRHRGKILGVEQEGAARGGYNAAQATCGKGNLDYD